MREGLLLLKLDRGEAMEPLYFVVKHGEFSTPDDIDGWEYFVEEHNCPTNMVRCAAIIDGEDTDPHGVFEFVQFVPMPPEWGKSGERSRDYYRRIFSKLPAARVNPSA